MGLQQKSLGEDIRRFDMAPWLCSVTWFETWNNQWLRNGLHLRKWGYVFDLDCVAIIAPLEKEINGAWSIIHNFKIKRLDQLLVQETLIYKQYFFHLHLIKIVQVCHEMSVNFIQSLKKKGRTANPSQTLTITYKISLQFLNSVFI